MENENPTWLKEAILYSLDIRTFKDSDGDGIGDINGLISKLSYLKDLGITCIWLAPFYKSPERDGGYDVADYYAIANELGTEYHFAALIKECKKLDLRIIIDLVINHTSNQHPWFQHASESKHNNYVNYYIWRKRKPAKHKKEVMFEGVEASNWRWNKHAQRYYYHTFYYHEPDLNATNPEVQYSIEQIIRFWMSKGIDGFRIDAVPHVLQNKGDNKFKDDPFKLLCRWREIMKEFGDDKVLIGETDVKPRKYKYFVDEKLKLNAIFNFYLNNYLFLTLASEKAKPVLKALNELEGAIHLGSLLNFIRNHDELDLEQLTKKERFQVYEKFAPEKRMLIYNRGIRRRPAPMFSANHLFMELTSSILCSLPGVPVIRYGDEIGMGEDLSLPERLSVRTVMQWSNERHGGFSTCMPRALNYPIIDQGPFAYDKVNVKKQLAAPGSLLSTTKLLLRLRTHYISYFTKGHFQAQQLATKNILAYSYELHNSQLIILHNISSTSSSYSIKGKPMSKPVEILTKSDLCTVDTETHSIRLSGYAYCWLLV
ncbi:alpha-amylase family glycosyl hydrolase [Olivibacter sp. CPCC 100613]|uniref:alpha-amylase family glycosyl hydrolase n=1 Tax=Olivibacter sp. CPCC 100613 TaxID=3079931 RepID=UPI002FF9444F